MNYSTSVFLINNHVRAIKVTYETEANSPRALFKSLDETIKMDDYVVVPTTRRHKMTVCKVVEVDADVDFESPTQIDWIIGTVDRTEYEAVQVKEQAAIAAIKAAELRKKREDLRDSMLKNHMDAIKSLPIADMNGNTPVEEPKV